MKSLFLTLAFVLTFSFVQAKENSKNENNQNGYIEYTIMTNESGEDTCYARFCWNASETQRRCTDWQEVPCDVELEIEGNRVE